MVKLLPAFFLFSFMVLIMAIVPPRTSVALHPSAQPPTAVPSFKQCWLVLLKQGSTEQNEAMLNAHARSMEALASQGKILSTGEIAGEDPNLQGLFVLNCNDSLEAERLLQTDTAITSGAFSYELKPWYTMKSGFVK